MMNGQQRNSWVLLVWPLVVLGVAFQGTWSTHRPEDQVAKDDEYCRAQIVFIAKDQSFVRLRTTADAPEDQQQKDQQKIHPLVGLTVPAAPPDLRTALKSELKVGDLVEYKPCGSKASGSQASGTQPSSTEAGASQANATQASAPRAGNASAARPQANASQPGSAPAAARSGNPKAKGSKHGGSGGSGSQGRSAPPQQGGPAPDKPQDKAAKSDAPVAAGSKTLEGIEIDAQPVDPGPRWLALVGAAALLLLFCWLVLGTGLDALVLGADNRYSKSKFQLVVWFSVVAVCYLSILWLRFCYSSNWLLGSVTIPTHLLMVSGLSALTFGGAKAITQNKQNQQAAAAAADPQRAVKLMKTHNTGTPSLIFDLVHDDGASADLGDFQMVFITLVAAVTYLVQFFTYLSALPMHAAVTIPDVDGTMLALFGLGHGAYLTKKLASGPGAAGPAGGNGGRAMAAIAPGGAPEAPPAVAPGGAPQPPPAGAVDPDRSRRIGNEA
jgi:hypothetical protein